MMDFVMRAAIYARISRDLAAEGLGVARQEQDCRALVERNGWTVAGLYVDNDVSAYSGKARTGYHRMLEGIKAGDIDAVVAWHPDRLHRAPKELEEFITIIEAAGARVATVQAGVLDLSSASGRMTARVVGAVARHESEQKSERQKRKHLQLAEDGMPSGGGWRPFGYERDRVTVRESEAEIVREMAARLLRGDSVRSVVAWMDGEGRLTTAGKRWQMMSVRRMIVSPRVAGKRGHRGVVAGDAVWPAILDEVTWQQLRRLFADPARNRNAGAGPRYLLTGLLFCGLCGSKLIARPNSHGQKCVVCATGTPNHGCGRIRQIVAPLDALIVEAVMRAVDVPATAEAAVADPEITDGLIEKIEATELRLRNLLDDYSDGTLSKQEWERARQRQTARLGELRRSLPLHRPAVEWTGRGVDLRERWPRLHIDQQRALVADLIGRIEIGPAVRGRNTFQPERVQITWR